MQWSSWLRRTRREPPTLEELQKDYLRQLRLQENVHRLEQEYKAEKLRLAEANQAALLQAPTAAGRPKSTDATTAAVDLKMGQEGLPADRGGVDEATAAKAPEVARNIGLGQKEDLSASEATARDDASGVATASPEELAERRRKQEEADAAKRRAEFGELLLREVGGAVYGTRVLTNCAFYAAKANAAPLKAQEKSAQQPEGWAPSAPARRR